MGEISVNAKLETLTSEPQNIQIIVRDGFFQDTMSVYINNKLVGQGKVGMLNPKGGEEFSVNGQIVIIKWMYNAWMGGKPKSLIISDGEKVIAQYGHDTAKRLPVNGGFSFQTPVWAWGFALACIGIPVINLGGAIAGGLGAFGAIGSLISATDIERSPTVNFMISLGITVFCWAVFIAFVAAVS